MKTLKKILIVLLFILSVPSLSFSQSCTITSKANDIIPDKLCAPVTVSWEVVYRGVDDGGTPVEIVFDWDDGTVETIAATNTDPSTQEWSVTATHVYPQGGDQCVYYPEATLQVNGVLCTSSSQQQMVTVWDVDTANGGHMEINPRIYHICVGNDATVIFQDVSTFNCVPPVEEDNPNETTRWTQWIYGTDYTINGVLIDGQTVTFPDTDAVVPITPPPVWSPQPPNEYSLPIYVPATAQVGEYFEVTLRNWNYCNPYDDPSIPGPPADTINGDHDPVTTTAIIIIEPYPDATIDTAGPFCANDPPVNLTAATPGGTWSGDGITNANNGRFDPSVAGPGLHTVYYTVANAYGCTNTDSAQILVYALPQPDILPGDVATVCPGYNLQLDGNPTPGDGNIISHLWSGDVGNLNATDIQTPVFNSNISGNYNMTYTVTDDNGCSNSDDIVVTVSAVNVQIMPEPADPCVNEDFQLFGNVSGGSGNYTSFLWTGETVPLSSASVQNPVFNSSVADTFHLILTVTDDNGCTGQDSTDVIVYEYPTPYAGPDDSVCGNTYLLSAVQSTGTGNWYKLSGPGSAVFDDNTLPVTNVTVNQYGVYEFVWREITGSHCMAEDTVVIDFIENPSADAGQSPSVCGLNVEVEAHPSVGTGLWTVIDGPGNGWFQNPNDSLTYFNADTFGVYTLVWTETNLICSDADTITAHLNVKPYAHFLPENPEGCQPFNITFNNLTSNATSYYWDFGDGNTSTGENPAHTYYNSTFSDAVYNVRLIATNGGCADTTYTTVTVHPDPQSHFSYDNTPACSPHTVAFTNESEGAVTYHWLYGDGSPVDTVDNAIHTFVNDTTFIQYYDVMLVAISEYGCTDTSSGFVTVYPNPDVNLTVIPDTLCSPGYATVMANPGYISYEWNYGDGVTEITSSNQMQHFYTNSTGNAEEYHLWVRAISQLGCVDTSYTDLVVMPTPDASFTTDITSICGSHNLEMINTSTGASMFVWDYGDGTVDTLYSQQTVYHYYENNSNAPTTFYITLYAYNSFGCADTVTRTLLVYPEIKADFSCDTLGCSPLTIQFDNMTNGASGYYWIFGDGTTSNDFEPLHTYINTYSNPVEYDVSLIVTSSFGCKDTMTRIIHVYPSPAASFTATPSTMTMPNSTVSVNNTTQGANWNCIWYWGNGDSSTVWQPGSYTYDSAGVFNIMLVVYNEYCSDTAYQTVTIVPSEPVASFDVDADKGCVPFTVHFTNTSVGGSVYLWDFGDGTSSHEENPEHTYTEAGTYNVHFSVTGQGGSDSEDLQIEVYPTPKAFFKVVPSEVSIPGEEIKCYNQSEGASTFLWDFGDGATSTLENPVHEYTETGVYTITLTVWNEYQCEDRCVQNDAVTAVSAGEIIFPNAFTPNPTGPNGGHYDENDFSNDVFHPIYKGVVEYELNIFNRWGELIFVSKDPKIGWDGYYRGKLCKQDVYVWKVRVKFSNGEVLEKVGDVTLLR